MVRPKRRGRSTDANSVPITLVVEFYGGEVKQGRNANVKCCMHDDSRRSAVMNTYDNLYFCHTCGKGGTGVNIIMEMEQVEYKDAAERAIEIASRGGHTLQSTSKRRGRSLPRRTWDI